MYSGYKFSQITFIQDNESRDGAYLRDVSYGIRTKYSTTSQPHDTTVTIEILFILFVHLKKYHYHNFTTFHCVKLI